MNAFNFKSLTRFPVRCFLYFGLGCLIFLGIFYHQLSIIAFLACLIFLIFSPVGWGEELLFFLLHFAWIFKTSTTSMSLFTLLTAIECLVLIFKKGKIQILPFFAFFLLIVICSFGQSISLSDFAKFAISLLLGFELMDQRGQGCAKNLIFAFSFGLIVSSCMGLFKSQITALGAFYKDMNYIYIGLTKFARFSGLWTDPNYYSLELTLSLFSLTSFALNGKMSKWSMALIPVIFVFGILTISKSFAIIALLFLLYLLIVLIKKKNWLLSTSLIVFICVIAIFTVSGSNVFISRTLSRFSEGEITTGRIGIWKSYISFLSSRPSILLTGVGINHAALINSTDLHNFYLEIIYHLGLAGGTGYLFLILANIFWFSSKNKNKNFSNFVVLFSLLISIFFLSELFNYCMPFFFALSALCLSEPFQPKKPERMSLFFN
jgi:O-antigen ligase